MKKIAFALSILFFSTYANAHIQHYNNLNVIKFDIFRNDSLVGYHNIIFSRSEGKTIVKNEIKEYY